jgi:hypothetical protein
LHINVKKVDFFFKIAAVQRVINHQAINSQRASGHGEWNEINHFEVQEGQGKGAPGDIIAARNAKYCPATDVKRALFIMLLD